MSFRLRLIVVSSAAVAIAIALVSVAVYVLVRAELFTELDRTLRDRSAQAVIRPRGVAATRCYTNVTDRLVQRVGGYFQKIGTDSSKPMQTLPEGIAFPITPQDRLVAANQADAFFRDATIAGQRVRVYTFYVPPNCALQIAHPYREVNRTLRRVAVALAVVSLAGIALSIVLGWIVAGMALRPVRRLTEASEHVALTRDLSRRMHSRGRDELARLAMSFNMMLEALDASLKAQRQLVADASHELRTPLTSVKTNVEVLQRAELPVEERNAILGDVVSQIDELTVLVTDIVDLARGVELVLVAEDVRLDLLVADAVERARRHAPGLTFKTELEPCVVVGVPSRLGRAIANLLDNASKWSPSGGIVEVRVKANEVSVRDHGHGIDEADLPFVFDRFYRAAAARALPGSGLGLAIVRQIADSHGAQVSVERPPGGGSLLRLRFAPPSES